MICGCAGAAHAGSVLCDGRTNTGKCVTGGADGVTNDFAGGGCTDAAALHQAVYVGNTRKRRPFLARNQYSFEKRRREIEKKRKKEEKRQRKLDKQKPSPEGNAEAPGAEDQSPPQPQE